MESYISRTLTPRGRSSMDSKLDTFFGLQGSDLPRETSHSYGPKGDYQLAIKAGILPRTVFSYEELYSQLPSSLREGPKSIQLPVGLFSKEFLSERVRREK